MRSLICARCREDLPPRPRHRLRNPRGRRLFTVSRRFHGNRCTPFLRLTGRWMRAAGFDEGQAVEVEVHRGRLVIRAVKAHSTG